MRCSASPRLRAISPRTRTPIDSTSGKTHLTSVPTAQFSSKGQIVIPKAIRDRHSFSEGQTVEVVDTPSGVLLRRVKQVDETLTMEEVTARIRARVKYTGPPVSIEEMNSSIDQMFCDMPDEQV